MNSTPDELAVEDLKRTRMKGIRSRGSCEDLSDFVDFAAHRGAHAIMGHPEGDRPDAEVRNNLIVHYRTIRPSKVFVDQAQAPAWQRSSGAAASWPDSRDQPLSRQAQILLA